MNDWNLLSPPTEDLCIHATNKLPATLQENGHILTSIRDRVAEHTRSLNRILKTENPFNIWAEALTNAEQHYNDCAHTFHDLQTAHQGFEKFAKIAKFPANAKYWDGCFSKIEMAQRLENNSTFKVSRKAKGGNEIQLLHRQLLDEWRKNFDRESEKWELSRIQQIKSAFLQQLDDWLERLKEISQIIDDLGLEPGHLLDFSKGSLTLSDISALKKWLEVVEQDQGIREICKILGRMRQVGHSTEIKRAKTTRLSSSYIQDSNSKEEIIGIKIGNEIEHVVPSELSLLSSEETAILFDLKFVESQLMCFDMAGQQLVEEEVEVYEDQEVEVKDTKGPIILCVDTSGSMHGSPENVAKAITLHMVNLASKDDRDCYLINFSTTIETLDFSSGIEFDTLLKFLQQSFHGGTDVAPAINHAIIKMNEDKYKNADLIVLSDFVMPSLPENIRSRIEKLRSEGNKFHSLCISQDFLPDRLRTLFDQEWVYNPQSSSVTELLSFGDAV